MIRPQILAAVLLLGILGGISLFLGITEVATATVAGIAALGTQLVEKP